MLTKMKYILMIIFYLFSSMSLAKIKLAITVDDLPLHSQIPSNTKRIDIARKMLDVFKRESIPEVYGFINAKKMVDEPLLVDVLKLWVDYGHPLGNHTYSHQSINKISITDFKSEIDNNEKILESLNKKMNWKYFRYPFLHEGNNLEKRNAIRSYLKEKKYVITQVTVDFEDWSWNDPYARCVDKNNSKQIKWLKKTYLKNAVDQLQRAEKISKSLFHRSISHILLLHIGAFDAEMIETLIKAYKKEGVEFMPLSEAVKDEVYAIDPAVTEEWGSELTYQIMKSKGLKLKDVGLKSYHEYSKEKLDQVCK